MEDFFLIEKDLNELTTKVKAIAANKNFGIQKGNHVNDILYYSCKQSPYFNMQHMCLCPFKVRYKFYAESETYQLLDYDEMHNH